MTPTRAWASDLAHDYQDISMVVRFHVAATNTHHVCLVMRDGDTAPWFAAGKGIDGVAWTTVPGRDARAKILADPRVAVPGLHLYMNFCDVRPLIFAYREGTERIAGEELLDVKYEVLFPEHDRLPALDEFFHCWGHPTVPTAAP